jgi:hypothetical protein
VGASRRKTTAGVDNAAGGDGISIAKIGLIGTVAVALITAATSIVVSIVTNDDDDDHPSPTSVTAASEEGGSITGVTLDQERHRVSVFGESAARVHTVYAYAGPNPTTGTYWAASTKPNARGAWTAVLTIDPPPIPTGIEVGAYFDSNQYQNPPNLEDGLECLRAEGSSCSELFGPAATYRP